jgi:hypothetical protein
MQVIAILCPKYEGIVAAPQFEAVYPKNIIQPHIYTDKHGKTLCYVMLVCNQQGDQ